MRSAFVLLAVSLLLASTAATRPATTATRLAISVYPKGTAGTVMRHYSLRCAPALGTIPHPGRACLLLARLSAPFAPVRRGVLCAQLSLGPQEAVVKGTTQGKPVDAHLSVNNSCEIERWRRVALVVPGFPG